MTNYVNNRETLQIMFYFKIIRKCKLTTNTMMFNLLYIILVNLALISVLIQMLKMICKICYKPPNLYDSIGKTNGSVVISMHICFLILKIIQRFSEWKYCQRRNIQKIYIYNLKMDKFISSELIRLGQILDFQD